METAAEAGDAEAEEGKWTCQQCDTVHMNPRKKECRICAAPRKERTSPNATNRKNEAKQWPNKQGNQTRNTTNELWNLIEAESNKIKATTGNPNTLHTTGRQRQRHGVHKTSEFRHGAHCSQAQEPDFGRDQETRNDDMSGGFCERQTQRRRC